jgi:hypothetical protein
VKYIPIARRSNPIGEFRISISRYLQLVPGNRRYQRVKIGWRYIGCAIRAPTRRTNVISENNDDAATIRNTILSSFNILGTRAHSTPSWISVSCKMSLRAMSPSHSQQIPSHRGYQPAVESANLDGLPSFHSSLHHADEDTTDEDLLEGVARGGPMD